MGGKEQRGISFYEYKLERVMKRLGVETYSFNWDRWGCYVDFRYKGELYKFEHSAEKARSRGVILRNGSESFIEVVLTFEDLATIVERGIYGLETWVRGIKYLPSLVDVPGYFKILGFAEIPGGAEEIRQRYENLTGQLPPDGREREEKVQQLKDAAEQALHYFRNNANTH